MTSVLLRNAVLAELDPPGVAQADLRFAGGLIAARGNLDPAPGEEVIDCGGAVVLPGLVNGHTHLYSALAVGMPPPAETPRSFLEILERVWWRLDRALDDESNYVSAHVGAIEALRCGTTTLIDHHASPGAIAGSLDRIEKGISDAGLRGVLCYETTDRNGPDGAEDGLAENARYARKCGERSDRRFAGLVGAHASFTLSDRSLGAIADLASRTETGVHIHVAEDPCDENSSLRETGIPLIDRLDRFGLATPRSIFAHCTHLDDRGVRRANECGVSVAHNTRSNMNNAVGYAPLHAIRCPVLLGTDGIGADMFAEAQTAWFKSRDARAGKSPGDIVAMLTGAARRASSALGVTLGKLQPGTAADIVVTDYRPATPLDTGNLLGHFLFGMSAKNVLHVFAGGKWALRDREVVSCDAAEAARCARRVSAELWHRMARRA